MPELPEVETIKLGLQRYLVGKTVEGVEVRVPKLFVGSAERIVGAKIIGLKRIGKGLIIELDNDFVLAIHLKMTGQLVYSDNTTKSLPLSPKIGGVTLPSKYSHVIFKLKTPHFAKASRGKQNSKVRDEGAYLFYNDLRRFGWVKVVRKDQLMQIPFFKEMGPEPAVAKAMAGKAPLNLNKFSEIVSQSSTTIKVLLMDQKKIGGIGNIYANDALFAARIDPRRKAKTLTEVEIKSLYDSLLTVLKKGLEYGGSSDENFVNALGQEGNYQDHALVYQRGGKRCRVCESIIQKIKLGGRGTYFCPACQK